MLRKSLYLDLAAMMAIASAVLGAWHFVQLPGFLNGALAAVLAYAALRITYEMTLNRHSVPTIASAPVVRRQVAALIAADQAAQSLQSYEVVDLGSGRGELARTIAQCVPRANVIGIELAFVPHWRAKLLQKLAGPKNLQFQQADFFTYDCGHASAVVLFLGKLTVPAGDKLLRELKPGSFVISNDFTLGAGWPEPETIVLRTPFKTILYFYRR